MDPGTALAIVGLALDAVKDVYAYYTVWKSRDDDVAEVRRSLLWLQGLFEAIEATLRDENLDRRQVQMICGSVEACEDVIGKLQKRLVKVKREMPPDGLMQKLEDQGRRALYPFQKGTIVRLLETIEKIREQMHVVIALLNLDTTSKSLKVLKEIDQKVDSIVVLAQDEAHEQKRATILDWLNPADQSEIHDRALRSHEPGTGSWFLGSSQFHDWRSNPGTSMWLYGQAGCGKTVLFSSIIKSIQDYQVTPSSSAFFYCLYRKGAQHDLSPIIRTFIAQLCPRDHIPPSLQTLYEQHSSKFPPGIPSDDELKMTLLAMVKDSTMQKGANPFGSRKDYYLLIDALDELPLGSSRDQILDFLNDVASMHIPGLHILATSRDENDISFGLRSWDPPLVIDKKKVAEDIRMYVSNEIQKDYAMSKQKDEIKTLIMHRLVEEGNAMFRWAALQLEELKALHPMKARNIKQALQSLPKDLDETYERILTKIPAGNSQEALSMLKWISFVARPLYIEELMDICAIQLDEEPEFDAEDRYSPRDIMDVLPGLITIDPPLKTAENPVYETHRVTFAHFSVLEYLVGTRIGFGLARNYALDAENSNHYLARCSIAYLSCCNTFELRSEDFPLRWYVWYYWTWHAAYQSDTSVEELSAAAVHLSEAVTQADLTASQVTLDRLATRLLETEKQKSRTAFRTRKQEDALRIPFFYPEFAQEGWSVDNATNDRPLINYKVDPLKSDGAEIRLVELFPSRRKFTEIRCRVFHSSLNSNPAFDGVSYASDLQDLSYIRANGLLLQVPRMLVNDLRNLRAKSGKEGRILFIYAVLFEDVKTTREEWQLSLVARVFKQAQQVAIGLGDKSDADMRAIEFVREIVSLSTPEGENMPLSEASTQTAHGKWSDGTGAAILELFQRRWWRRTWPVQELMLPRKATLYYGDEAIMFDTFQRFFEMEKVISRFIGEDFYAKLISDKAWIGAKRVSMLRAQYIRGVHPTLPQLLWASQYHLSREPIDKVFVLLGILHPDEQKGLLQIHDSTCSDELYFTGIANHILSTYANLDILSYTGCHRSTAWPETSLPSWVPDFGTSERGPVPLVEGIFGPPEIEYLFDASGDGVYEARASGTSNVLTIKGFNYDVIHTTFETLTGQESHAQIQALYDALQALSIRLIVPAKQTSQEALWRTIQADQRDGQRLGPMPDTVEFSKLLEHHDIDLKFCKGRCLAITSKGYLCLVSEEAKAGDVIAVLSGGRVPYVLRSSGTEYVFVGECYIHQIMDGQTVQNDVTVEYSIV